MPDGRWTADFRQAKTKGKKALGAYWPVTSRIIDLHVLAGQSHGSMTARLHELDDCNLLGHSSRWMQQSYRSDFRDTAAMEKYHDTMAQIVSVGDSRKSP